MPRCRRVPGRNRHTVYYGGNRVISHLNAVFALASRKGYVTLLFRRFHAGLSYLVSGFSAKKELPEWYWGPRSSPQRRPKTVRSWARFSPAGYATSDGGRSST